MQGNGQIIWRDGTRQPASYSFRPSLNATDMCSGHFAANLSRTDPLQFAFPIHLIRDDGDFVDLLIMGHRDDGAVFIGHLASPANEEARNGSGIKETRHDNRL
ncbi:hypothetical protein AB4099_21760 [Bosea sp. 2KB_26]|uniref:hypothetical protein n=1 Tax=Bosea sp. 2KB_26 TaxID=3237475 RepID=UPI000DE2EE1A